MLVMISISKNFNNQFGKLFHDLWKSSPSYRRFHWNSVKLFILKYEWKETIDYQEIDSDHDLYDLSSDMEILSILDSLKSKGIDCFKYYEYCKEWVIRWVGNVKRSYNSMTLDDYRDIIVCPSCKRSLEWNSQSLDCLNCSLRYPRVKNIPCLLIDHALKL